MSGLISRAVIGKGFGDEGKGLAVDYFCSKVPETLVIKHNGGAQAGHTVELEGKRFVFHQLASGSFRHSKTFWTDTYYPDLYKLREEMEAFHGLAGFTPEIFCDVNTPVTLIDDVIINMLLESARGDARHGSCGMGINEAFERTKAGFGMTVRDFLGNDARALVDKILSIRETYGKKHMRELEISANGRYDQEYLELLDSRVVVENAVEEMQQSADTFVTLAEHVDKMLGESPEIVFETGQGLLLDAENPCFAPHVTASRTGLTNPVHFLEKYGLSLTEAVYVTRTYVTRHGAGPLPYECGRDALGIKQADATNVDNPWQGSLRYARHGSIQEFLAPIQEDLKENIKEGQRKPNVSLFLTHLNETNEKLCMKQGDVSLDTFSALPEIREDINMLYLSSTRVSKDIVTLGKPRS
ncbi:MAG: adenylosuccinate synthetase [Lachnospiraceae bacterium]|nr:adenylosuccinate synthetase [Lachnospiraceae bacterium]